jgi:hypothetical protein
VACILFGKQEETGFVADEAGAEETPIMYNDPGITNANMKMVIVNVWLLLHACLTGLSCAGVAKS